jgi:hypothetical protein
MVGAIEEKVLRSRSTGAVDDLCGIYTLKKWPQRIKNSPYNEKTMPVHSFTGLWKTTVKLTAAHKSNSPFKTIYSL